MILNRKGQLLPETVHDHGPRPECLNVKFRHNGTNGIALRGALTAEALPHLAIIGASLSRKLVKFFTKRFRGNVGLPPAASYAARADAVPGAAGSGLPGGRRSTSMTG